MTEKNFVQIPNVAFAFGTEYKLNNDELKVLTYLQFMKNVGTMKIRTHVTIIVEDLGWATSKSSRDNTRVANALEGLLDKGYIAMTFNKEIKKDALAIEITIDKSKKAEAKSKVEWKANPFNFKGYTEIKVSEYNLAGKDDYHLTVMAYHNWRANAKFEYAIADKEWAEVLELSAKHARAIIENCDFLTKISGEKFINEQGQWQQETNQYIKSVQTKVSDIESNNKNMTILEKEWEKVTDENIKLDSEIFNQIFNKKEYFKFDGYKAWKETTCEYTKQAGQKKIDAIAKSEKGAFVVKRLEEDYEQYIANQKQTEAMMKRHQESQIDDFEVDEEWQGRQSKIRAEKRKRENKHFIFDDAM